MSSERKGEAIRLWEKGAKTSDAVLRFTVGDDPELDLALVRFDCQASAAHVQMLAHVGLLTEEEGEKLTHVLSQIADESAEGRFEIPYELEDMHTAIEARLVSELGELGKKVHTGRSRNDQVAVALRLFMRSQLKQIRQDVAELIELLFAKADSLGELPLSGYTHMQRAMPSSVGMWLHAFIAHGLELLEEASSLDKVFDSCPLGSAAGFGTPLPLDREFVAKQLGFSRVQFSVTDVQNSRGRYEKKLCRYCGDIGSLLEKLASDLMLFLTKEFGFFTLSGEATTGSSIMPQKQNPDVVELLRAHAARLPSYADEISLLTAKLPSNYHRDLQLTKEPLLRCVNETGELLEIAKVVLHSLVANEKALKESLSSEVFVTYQAFRLVEQGASFRDAYVAAAKSVGEKTFTLDDFKQEYAALLASHQAALDKSKQRFSSLTA